MTENLTIGFLPLVDACLPILAHEHGFAEEEGLALTFQRDVSWATVLDRLLYGHSDAAHMLAPLAIATTLGRGRPAQPLAAPCVLGLNGNAITLTPELAGRIDRMVTVYQAKPLTMSWCVECHRNPEPNLRDPANVTVMGYKAAPGESARVKKDLQINPPTDCSTCHR